MAKLLRFRRDFYMPGLKVKRKRPTKQVVARPSRRRRVLGALGLILTAASVGYLLMRHFRKPKEEW
jgi:hypothetical protein